LELADLGTIFDVVLETGPMDEPLARHYFAQFLDGLSFIHDKGYVHRDLKAENLLLDDQFDLKIADFGFAKYTVDNAQTTYIGTEPSMAPEIVAKEDGDREYNPRVADIFATAVILFTIVSQRPPFFFAQKDDQFYKYFEKNTIEKFWRSHEKAGSSYSDEFK
jgi:serine/threonine protein kinase